MANNELLKIGYIDEDQADIDKFCRFAEPDFEIKDLKPNRNTTLKQIIDWVKETGIAALIVDYNLKERDSVKFFGSEIVEKLHKEFLDFPAFVITSFEGDAINGTKESDLVFTKKAAWNKAGKELLKARIRNKIVAHQKKLATSAKKYADLVNKKTLSLKEENELLDLDSFIERSHGKIGHISKLLKTNKNYEKLSELVRKVEKLTLEIKKNKK